MARNFYFVGNSVPPNNYQYFAVYHSNTIWTVPQGGWYRIWAVGKSADGGNYYGICVGKLGSQGGASGGVAASVYRFAAGTQIPLTFDNGTASFGNYFYATAAQASYDNYNEYMRDCFYVNSRFPSPKYMYPTDGGQGYNGNLYNFTGYRGTRGGLWGGPKDSSVGRGSGNKNGGVGLNSVDENGVNNGAWGGNGGVGTGTNFPGGGGGGAGARLPGDNVCPYISAEVFAVDKFNFTYKAGNGRNDGVTSTGPLTNTVAYPEPIWDSRIMLYGGGMGGGGASRQPGTLHTAGNPACIIIEKGVR